MDLTDLVDRAVPFRFEIDGFPLSGSFYKYRITPNYLTALEKMEEEGSDESERGYKIISDSIKEWDMTKGGAEFPPTVENLKEVPVVYLIALGKHLGDLRDGNPTEVSPNGS